MPSRGLGSVATVVDGAQPVRMRRISEDLGAHGVARLMVEGGGKVHTKFLIANLVDELHPCAPRSFGARPGSSAGAQRSTAAQTAIQSADGLFHAVTVPAGSHHITFSFVPPGVNRRCSAGWPGAR
jgi:riboflavin biosynthesis pyrimidine reductase